jgi:predicted DNA-binding ribbon-helix-helix protein
MPTNKAPFTFHLEDEYLEKMKYIAKRDTRSLSNLLEHLCKLHIEQYEKSNGEIDISNIIYKNK